MSCKYKNAFKFIVYFGIKFIDICKHWTFHKIGWEYSKGNYSPIPEIIHEIYKETVNQSYRISKDIYILLENFYFKIKPLDNFLRNIVCIITVAFPTKL